MTIYPSHSGHLLRSLFFLFLSSFIAFLLGCSSTEETRPVITDPEASLKDAIELLDDKEYEEARQLLTEIIHADTSRTFAPLAQLKIAESYSMEEDRDLAIVEYKRFLEQYPDSRFAAYTQFQIASLYFEQIKGPERGAGAAKLALKEYETLQARYPRNPYREIAEANIQKCKDTIASYEFIVGRFYFKKDSYRAALGRFLGIVENYPDFQDMEKVYYHIALSYHYLGDPRNAQKYFNKLATSFPSSELIEELSEEMSDD